MSEENPTYIYGVTYAEASLPDDLEGLGPSGKVTRIISGQLAAVVGDIPLDRPLGLPDDYLKHEAVVNTIAQTDTVIPMRFGSVLKEIGVTEELLGPHQEHFLGLLREFDERNQYTLKSRYDQEGVVREVITDNENVRALYESVMEKRRELQRRELSPELIEAAVRSDNIQLGELITKALEVRRRQDAELLLADLEPLAVTGKILDQEQPEDLVNAGFLVGRDRQQEFENRVDEVGARFPLIFIRLIGPIAPFDFVPGG